ncbi:hypothetical protein VP01_1258g5 [Puccinia sorghi]|uniref:F-box domain-containing protein n=1 Tax=Puccinia sorghi TaxID=27349 RepID=A0A0L6VP97_9BASI|nr:hypothetical protein VP01_1258g5 [Puccinia sorghi]
MFAKSFVANVTRAKGKPKFSGETRRLSLRAAGRLSPGTGGFLRVAETVNNQKQIKKLKRQRYLSQGEMAKISDLPPELIHRIIDHVINQSNQQHCPLHHHHHLDHNSLEFDLNHTPPPPQPNQPDHPPSTSTRQPANNNTNPSASHQINRYTNNHNNTNNHNHNNNQDVRTDEQHRFNQENQNENHNSNQNRPHRQNPAANPNNITPFDITDFSISFTSGPIGELGFPAAVPTHTHDFDLDEDEEVPNVSWPDGLPSDPLVIFSLVNRPFQQCAQARLYKNVALYNPWQANLFLRTLNRNKSDCSPFLHQPGYIHASVDIKGKRRAQFGDGQATSPRIYRRLNRLGDHVRSLRFMWTGPASMGKGGGSLICDIIQSCPQLENIGITTALLSQCKEPLFHSLERLSLIKEFSILKNPVENPRKFLWKADEVLIRLFSKWDMLETVELIGLSGRPLDRMESVLRSIPSFNCTLRKICLTRPNLAEIEISKIINTSKATLHTLQITYPSLKLDRKGLYRILLDYTNPNLGSLTIHVSKDWHPINVTRGSATTSAESSNDPAQNPHLLDILFKSASLRSLKSLSIGGPLASSKLFPLLPETIIKLAWEDCSAIQPSSFAKFLSSWSKPTTNGDLESNSAVGVEPVRSLPDLKCCSNQHPPGFIPPPPAIFQGMFGMSMSACSFPWSGSPGGGSSSGVDRPATTWMFGSAGVPPPRWDSARSRSPVNSSGSATNPTRTQASRSNSNLPSHHNPPNGTQSRNSTSAGRSQAPQGQLRSNQAGSSTASNSAPTGQQSSSSSARRPPNSSGLFGPDFKFRKMFD